MIMKMKPNGDYVLLKDDAPVTKTASGIIIPDSVENHYTHAEVIAVGPGLFTMTGDVIPMRCQIGDRVMVQTHQIKNNRISIDGTEYSLVHESEIAMISTNN
jgi:chaperonin GroES